MPSKQGEPLEFAEDEQPPHKRDTAEIPEDVRERAAADAEQLVQEAEIVASTRGGIARVEAAVRRSERFAKILDTFGVDPILGIIPGVGDLPPAAIGLYIVGEALRAGVPKWKIVRMIANLTADLAIGAIPIVGDIADFFFKANKRNVKIFQGYLEELRKGEKQSGQ